MALAVVAGAAIGILTQLPVAALLGGIGAFMAPSVIGGRAELEHEMSVIEGIASWAEMLRDTMAAAGGLEQSIIASATVAPPAIRRRSEEHTSELQSLMRISYAVFCLQQKKKKKNDTI